MERSLRTESLVKTFRGRTVVAGVSISLEAGEVVGLLGPNGAGKTTTFYMVLGLLKPDRGKVMLNGEDITELRNKRGVASRSERTGAGWVWRCAPSSMPIGSLARRIRRGRRGTRRSRSSSRSGRRRN